MSKCHFCLFFLNMDFVEKINIGLTSSGTFTYKLHILFFPFILFDHKICEKKITISTNPTRFANFLYASMYILESVKNL